MSVSIEHARVLWEYLVQRDEPCKSDVLVVLGSDSLRVPKYASALYAQGYAASVVLSGGVRSRWWLPESCEAARDARILAAGGVPREAMILEKRSTNTAENIQFSKNIILERFGQGASVLFFHKPYMLRRVRLTLQALWPDTVACITCEPTSFDTYESPGSAQEALIHILVGNVDRLIKYPSHGFFAAEDIPAMVLHAYRELVIAGYTDYRL